MTGGIRREGGGEQSEMVQGEKREWGEGAEEESGRWGREGKWRERGGWTERRGRRECEAVEREKMIDSGERNKL